MKVEVLSTREDLAGIARQWDELAANDPRDGFFRTSAWYQAWMEHIRPDAKPHVIVVTENGRIAGLAPLCQLNHKDLGFNLDCICWAGRDAVSGDFLDLVSEPGNRGPVMEAILSFVAQATRRSGLLVFSELLEGGESYNAVETFSRRNGLPLRRQEERICPYIALPNTFDDYLNTLGSSTRYNIRRRIRECERKGVRVEVFSQPNDVAARIDTLIDLHLSRWRNQGLPGTLGRPGFRSFLRHICANPPRGGGSRLYMLNYDGVPAGALLAFCYGQSMLYYQAGWDPKSPLASHSPALVAMAHSIREAIENKFQYYEFLRGDEAYKFRWTKTYRRTATVLLARSWMAEGYLRVLGLKDYMKRLVRPTAAPSSTPSEEPA